MTVRDLGEDDYDVVVVGAGPREYQPAPNAQGKD